MYVSVLSEDHLRGHRTEHCSCLPKHSCEPVQGLVDSQAWLPKLAPYGLPVIGHHSMLHRAVKSQPTKGSQRDTASAALPVSQQSDHMISLGVYVHAISTYVLRGDGMIVHFVGFQAVTPNAENVLACFVPISGSHFCQERWLLIDPS